MNYELRIKCNNSIFNQKYFLQTDGIVQGPHMSCSYRDISSEQFDKKALEPTLQKVSLLLNYYNIPNIIKKGFEKNIF